ncbi:MAG: glycoside hydrolase family 88 protein [Colwellia sp.]
MKYFKRTHSFITLPIIAAVILAAGCVSKSNAEISDALDKKEIYKSMQLVADWQWSRFNSKTNLFEGYGDKAHMSATSGDSHPQGWVYAAFYVGMAKWAKLADQQGNDSYYRKLHQIAQRNQYLVAPRIYNADDYAIGQLYLDLYEKYNDPKMIAPLQTVFNIILNSPPTIGLYFERVTQKSQFTGGNMGDQFDGRGFAYVPCKNRWCWADALFMGPPVWVHLAKVTGDQRYLDYADSEFWATVDLLWDKEDHLFFRDSRFFDKREKNGEKVIWARGVGWVAAGLARVLEHLPQDHPKRTGYEDIFKKLMTRLAGAQQSDGFWRPSVLAPEAQPYKESSGTALMAYAFVAGVNQGILDKAQFMPVITKAWSALVSTIQRDGKMGWVQQIAASPDSVSADDSQIYAVGGFLLTGSELYKMLNEDKP